MPAAVMERMVAIQSLVPVSPWPEFGRALAPAAPPGRVVIPETVLIGEGLPAATVVVARGVEVLGGRVAVETGVWVRAGVVLVAVGVCGVAVAVAVEVEVEVLVAVAVFVAVALGTGVCVRGATVVVTCAVRVT